MDLCLRQNRLIEERIGVDRGLEDDRFGIGLRDTVGVRTRRERSRCTDSGRRNNSDIQLKLPLCWWDVSWYPSTAWRC